MHSGPFGKSVIVSRRVVVRLASLWAFAAAAVVRAAVVGATMAAAVAGAVAGEVSDGGEDSDLAAVAAGRVLFESRIRPLLVNHCYECHSASSEEPQGGLLLDTRMGLRKGGQSGPAIVPGSAVESRLIRAVRYTDVDLRMPPDGKLSDRQIEDLVQWVESGAFDPRANSASRPSSSTETFDLESRRRQHWAWQPIEPAVLPPVGHPRWARSPLDLFVLAALQRAGLSPAVPADKHTLIRRVTFDLTGVPPSIEAVEAFLEDERPASFDRLVDRLLASPRFGEHWAQRWLDVVRYAETRGHEQDFAIPQAYRYRDYVIRAFNEDVPYDLWILEHVAGDLLADPRRHLTDASNQSIQGTGFWHLGEASHSPVDIRGDEADRAHNQIDVFSRAFLGLGMGCARCHDHKFDAISTRDYYAMYGYLQSSSFQLADVSDPVAQQRIFDQLVQLRRQYEPRIRRVFVELKRRQLQRLPAYLLAVAGRGKASGTADRNATSSQRLHAVTIQRVEESLCAAQNDIPNPLHVFARVGLGNTAPNVEVIRTEKADTLRSIRRREAESLQRLADLQVATTVRLGPTRQRLPARDWQQRDVVEDFSTAAPDRWITSGFRFGSEPCRIGDLLLGTSSGRPVRRVLDTRAAESTLISSRHTGLLRTRTFEITSDRLWYRFRGRAEVFLAVDSHRVVHGPLHGVVRSSLEGPADAWRWQSHTVRDYIGHRVHVEFSPGADFALDRIVFARDAPSDIAPANRHVLQMLGDATVTPDPLRALAENTAGALKAAVENLALYAVGRDDASLLNWMLEHEGIFEPQPSLQASLKQLSRQYAAAREDLENQLPSPVLCLAMLDGSSENEPVHIRGNHRNRTDDEVPRAILTALGGTRRMGPRRGSGRLDLAQRLVEPSNPLGPRVMVNRLWHHLFGRGIVQPVDELGAMGTRPSHPELLDYLAGRSFQVSRSRKRMLRDMVLSNTYRMASRARPECETRDPDNRLWHRMPIRRLPAEAIRDHVLAVSGRWDTTMYGPSVPVHITPFMRGNRTPKQSGPLDGEGRRSIYIEVRRNHLPALLVTFDRPAPFASISRRGVSNAPAQALVMLNHPLVHQQAGMWADRLLAETGATDRQRLRRAYLQAYARPPDSDEQQMALDYLEVRTQRHRAEGHSDARRRAWHELCHTLMNVKEFTFLP